jgi:hypothetical protein
MEDHEIAQEEVTIDKLNHRNVWAQIPADGPDRDAVARPDHESLHSTIKGIPMVYSGGFVKDSMTCGISFRI